MKDRGFTLMEMIVTIVVGSFIMLGIAGYVQLGMKGYADTIDRQRIQTQAQFVLEKMTREIRHAVPNSFHVPKGTTNCLEFMPIEYSGFYTFKNNDLEFLLGNDSTLNPIPANRRIVINPSRYEDLQSTSSRNIAIGGLAKTGKVFVVSGGQVRLRDPLFLAVFIFIKRSRRFATVLIPSKLREMVLRLRIVSIRP